MKNKVAVLLLMPLTFTLTGCFDDGSWKAEYGTPELFLEHVEGTPNLYLYDKEVKYSDIDFEVRDLIKESGPFESINKRKATKERYFTYEAYWKPATGGPNFCNMSIWADGLIRIDHKSSLGPHGYVYFSMDATKASHINDVVFEKLEAVKKIREEDETKAKTDGSIQNFLSAMEEKTGVPARVYDKKKTYDFNDSGEVLSVMKSTTYTPIDKLSSEQVFWYNYGDEWNYELWGTSVVRLEYHYKNRLDENEGIVLIYSIESSKGQAIYNKALEVAKRS